MLLGSTRRNTSLGKHFFIPLFVTRPETAFSQETLAAFFEILCTLQLFLLTSVEHGPLRHHVAMTKKVQMNALDQSFHLVRGLFVACRKGSVDMYHTVLCALPGVMPLFGHSR